MNQFKTLTELQEYIAEIKKQRGLVLARPTPTGANPLFYQKCDVHELTVLVSGIQEGDYCFSLCRNWVEPHPQMGLSFSASWKHLKNIYKLKAKKNPNKKIDVYWTLDNSNLPPDMQFVPDENDSNHYFLTVTKKMTVEELVGKLSWIADRMSVIRDATRAVV